MSAFQYRINFQILRSPEDEDEFEEIGFGAADSRTVDGAGYEIGAAIQRREWETEPGYPDPTEVDA